ncbi:hypothetical protein HELRODRAFT_116792 [Helobdella robusta]|uniref:SAM domain-containing protein n=1 Tax=Helobdella robusta TaxID=6412 RepID=T1EGH9_HELRO|nr:hypothetical protein HELRODRAFT_116792 [Helobdella robusta]ESO11355.1 hypothetical protein HELRODRAFT_116792 [Helobdella robusta]
MYLFSCMSKKDCEDMWTGNNRKGPCSTTTSTDDKMDGHCTVEQRLIIENNDLKSKLCNLEKRMKEKDQQISIYESRLSELQATANDQTIELNQLRNKLMNMASPDKSHPMKERTLEREQTLERLKKKHLDVEKLKAAMENLMTTNEEKNAKIDEMSEQLRKYRLLHQKVACLHADNVLLECGLDAGVPSPSSSSSIHHAFPTAASTPRTDATTTSASLSALPSPVKPSSSSLSSNSYTNIGGHELKTPPASKRQLLLLPTVVNGNNNTNTTTTASSPASGMSNNNSGANGDETLKDELAQEFKAMQNQPTNQEQDKKKSSTAKTIKRLFHRLRRSNSQEFDGKMEEFKRSALRSTAGPRLGWNTNNNRINFELKNSMDKNSFSSWDADRIALWMHGMGLSCYAGECKRWLKSGEQLLTATSHDLEKELGMKNAFHRKKLQLAMQVITSDPTSPVISLDHNWVQKWLDDIGLPQYKDQFLDARIDGCMINYLTNEDLQNLKVMSLMHHMSFKCGIQVLRHHNFDAQALKRRPASNEEMVLQNCPHEVCTWTNHRVMEWLRSIDLSEYSPNLRGSGVHGGLMVLEPRFSADVLAAILSIPSNKTLLRRHLTTHFVSLVGSEVQQMKRSVENEANYIPLSTNQKVKPSKKIGLFRPRTSEMRDDFVCPLHLKSLQNFKLESLSNKTPDVLYASGCTTATNTNSAVAVAPIDKQQQTRDHEHQQENLPTSDV